MDGPSDYHTKCGKSERETIIILGPTILPWRMKAKKKIIGWSSRKNDAPIVFLPGESYGQRSLVGYSPWDHKELATTERHAHTVIQYKVRVCVSGLLCLWNPDSTCSLNHILAWNHTLVLQLTSTAELYSCRWRPHFQKRKIWKTVLLAFIPVAQCSIVCLLHNIVSCSSTEHFHSIYFFAIM